MASRDYGSFSRAAVNRLAPLVEEHGYRKLKGARFGRERNGWIEGFTLDQSVRGGGAFFVHVGIFVPEFGRMRGDETSDEFSLTIGERLGSKRISGDSPDSFPAADAVELQQSIELVAQAIPQVNAWFATFKTMEDIAAESQKYDGGDIGVINQALLYILAGNKSKARTKLEYAQRRWAKIVADDQLAYEKRRPGKEAAMFMQLNVDRLEFVNKALRDYC